MGEEGRVEERREDKKSWEEVSRKKKGKEKGKLWDLLDFMV